MLGDFKEAVEDFEEALKYQKDFESARMGLEASKETLKREAAEVSLHNGDGNID